MGKHVHNALSRARLAPLLVGMVLLGNIFTAAPTAYAQTKPTDTKQSQQAPVRDLEKDVRDYLGTDAPEYDISPGGITKDTDPKTVRITIHTKDKGDVVMKLDRLTVTDRKQGGQKLHDYIFRPETGSALANTKLQFVYRVGKKSPSWGLIYGKVSNDDESLSSGRIGSLRNFDETALAKELLGTQEDEVRVDYFKEKGIPVNVDEESFWDRSDSNDPFALALAKMGEMVNAINSGLTGALTWAMNLGTLDKVPGLEDTWETVRNLVNLLFVITLVALAILTIMRIEPQSYSVRSILPMLIFAVIGVNFSLVFANILSNTAFVLSQPFADAAQALVEGGNGFGQEVTSSDATGFGQAMVFLLASVILLIALFILLFFFIVRIIVVWLLAALSPVLFLFLVLPLTRGESKKLLQQWVKWVYMAPISFLVLYIASQVAFPALQQEGGPADSTALALVRALFYAGVILAAVMIPYALGGQAMRLASKAGRSGGKLGGKAGFGLFGGVPIGRGMTLGEGVRTGKAIMENRSASQKNRAQRNAADLSTHLHDRLGNSGLATTLTGMDATQNESVLQKQIQTELESMKLIGMNEESWGKIANYRMGKLPLSALNPREQAYTRTRVAELAAVKGLAEGAYWSPEIANRYGWTGYQGLFKDNDPLMGHLKKLDRNRDPNQAFTARDFDLAGVGIHMQNSEAETLRKVMPSVWDYADPTGEFAKNHREASMVWRKALGDKTVADEDPTTGKLGLNTEYGVFAVDSIALNKITDATARAAAGQANREAIGRQFSRLHRQAQDGVLMADLQRGADFVPLAGVPGTSDVSTPAARERAFRAARKLADERKIWKEMPHGSDAPD